MTGSGTGYGPKVHKDDGGDTLVVESGGTIAVRSGGVISYDAGASSNRANEKLVSAGNGKAGATAGWAMPSAHSGFTNADVAGLPASQTSSTFVIPLSGLKVGDTISAFKIAAQIQSAGGAVTLDADLRKLKVAAADNTDASLGTITQVAVTAQTAVSASKTLATPEVVAADQQYYILLTGTTAASTDIQLIGATISISEA